jgi:hypothetical protein
MKSLVLLAVFVAAAFASFEGKLFSQKQYYYQNQFIK